MDLPAAPADPTGRPRVLVVEDDRELREMLIRLFQEAGYRVDGAPDGQAGLHQALTREYQIMIIDRGLPAIDGLDLLGRLRRKNIATPTLILTAYGAVADRVAGLDAGAEDYLVKPFEVDELLARVRALRRTGRPPDGLIPIGTGALDAPGRLVVRADGAAVELSGREARLLRLLAAAPSRVFTREDLRRAVFDAAESNSIVDTYVHYLRRKLGNGVIRTVRGTGYRIGAL